MQQFGFYYKNLLSAQHVSGSIMPIIRSSRVIQMVAACGTWRFGLQVIGLAWSCRFCVLVTGYCSTCWADHKFCNKNQSVASSWPFIFHTLSTTHGQTHIKFKWWFPSKFQV